MNSTDNFGSVEHHLEGLGGSFKDTAASMIETYNSILETSNEKYNGSLTSGQANALNNIEEGLVRMSSRGR